jgi:Zn-finger nucleic acid-binding protein
MNCPRDGAALVSKAIAQTPVQTCPTCGGMFLEHGQLNRVAEPTPGDLEFSTVDLDSFQHEDDHGPIACPRDGTTMRKVDFNIDTAIILDYCTTCHGFWLDAKELERINEEVKRLNEAGNEIPDPLLVRIAQFFWSLPVPH